MRTIKFRAWNKDFKCWIHFDAIRWVNDEPQELLVFEGKNTTHLLIWGINSLRTPESQNIELSQFTGLKDKNGKEVYEGDILNCDQQSFAGGVNVVVEWAGSGFYAGYGPHIPIPEILEMEAEVIGNMFETPELLTEIK